MKAPLKAGLALAGLFGVALAAHGQNPPLDYRAGDPFLFCTQGQDVRKNPLPCWKPLPPYTGNWMMMPYCRPPNYYGKRWNNDDTRSLQQYLSVCPKGEQPGRWQGPGRPEHAPFTH